MEIAERLQLMMKINTENHAEISQNIIDKTAKLALDLNKAFSVFRSNNYHLKHFRQSSISKNMIDELPAKTTKKTKS